MSKEKGNEQKLGRNHCRRPSTLAFGSSKLGVPSLERKSSSDPELGSRATVIGNERGFPAGLTVDELGLYRRRRPPTCLRPKDNLKPEEGSLKSITSEYRRRFIPHPVLPTDKRYYFGEDHLVDGLGAPEVSLVTNGAIDTDGKHQALVKRNVRSRKPEDGLKLEGEAILRPEYYDTFVDFPRQRPKVIRPRTHITSENHRELPMNLVTEKNAQYVLFDGARRPELARRQTTLHAEGDVLVKLSEIHSCYVPHEGAKRSDLARRKTSLRMEGEIDAITEQKDKYVGFPERCRAELSKRATQLCLEGEIDALTENNEKYILFRSPERTELKRRPTNLKLEGGVEKMTENSSNFIEFLEAKRAEMLRRSNNLHLEGDIQYASGYRDTYIDFPRERPIISRPRESLKQEGDLDITTEKKSQFIDFVSKCKRPDLARKPTNLRLEGKLESKPEYRDSYVDFPRQRPKVKKPDISLKPEGDIEKITEKKAQFIPFSISDRPVSVKRPPSSLRLEGEMNTNPEYKESFTNFPRERPVVKKPAGHLQHDPKTLLLFVDEPVKEPRGPGRPPESNLRSQTGIATNPDHRSSHADLPRERAVTRRTQGHLGRQNRDTTLSDSPITRGHSERRHRRTSDVEVESKRTYVDYTARGRTPSRRRPEDNMQRARNSSLATEISSPHMSRRLNVSTSVAPMATHGPGVYHSVSRVEPMSRAKAVTFELGGSRPKTCPWGDSTGALRQNTKEPSQLPAADTGSYEPTFRLHVMNVDDAYDENDDFARRRRRGRRRPSSRSSPPHPTLSRSIVSSRAPSPEIAHQFPTTPQVQYPLFPLKNNSNPAFVVLDDLNNNSRMSQAPMATPRSNFLQIPPGKQQPQRGGSHGNWMAPWHDAPASI
ncbi:uncharacterized protein LOC111862495 isoform X2 [Cryptotermes secundus]|uniref:uncharacterized protein LOC111862495 isoform X2 n=1 Tax=Cryptotermes secundus TaxID=105785 RepID=UPI000CD7CD0D|nr:uncharacterized protein LOC111862495 isoform X2 [Cryptotermes secundus]